MFTTDYIINGEGHGPVAGLLADTHYDTGLMRPFIDDKGRHVVTVNTRRKDKDGNWILRNELIGNLMARGLVINGPTSLRKDEWIRLDEIVLKAARARLRAWADLSAESSYGGFDAMSKMILEHETMNDPGEAMVDLDGLTEGRNATPSFQLEGIPLPITHSDFWMSQRRLMISRNTGTPLDSAMAEVAGRRVAELIEKTLIGTVTGMTHGTDSQYSRASMVYGYTNFPDRITSVNLTTPTGSNASTTVSEVLQMIEAAADSNYFGPFMLYHSTDWDRYLDQDYILTGGNVATQTLRNRLRAIEQIRDVRRLDYLTASSNPFTFILVQMTSDVARAINGMPITTVQWPSMGGLRLNFKVMTIQVPQLRSDYEGRCGIVHAS